ncbi:ribosomal RNA large subunit methyltransferase E [Caballeronia insecticola]|uniref:Ribosomal RNA large subunit methyltransferase E n=3 Tax=Pseudomonadota TaxID=1224 RepID=R4WZ83_9BURK|nr:ribosomal RNA large subunit methyltransferase E [Caballeronia insecticola]
MHRFAAFANPARGNALPSTIKQNRPDAEFRCAQAPEDRSGRQDAYYPLKASRDAAKYAPGAQAARRTRSVSMAKNRFSHSWLHDHINDPYVKMAQREGYRARAAYKLKEIDEQDKLIKPGQVIVDLGSTPGSWSQYARNKLAQSQKRDAQREGGIDGTIIALDILPMEPIADVTFIQGDFREDDVLAKLDEIVGDRQVDLVISDMAPNLSGVASADAARIEHLCDLALEFAQNHLKPDGALLVKCFHGSGYSQIVEKFKQQFKVVAPRKPKASRDKSSETFILGRRLKHPG